MKEIPKLDSNIDESEAKQKLWRAMELIHEIYVAIEDVTLGEAVVASGPLRRVLDIYTRTGGDKIITDLATSDTPF